MLLHAVDCYRTPLHMQSHAIPRSRMLPCAVTHYHTYAIARCHSTRNRSLSHTITSFHTRILLNKHTIILHAITHHHTHIFARSHSALRRTLSHAVIPHAIAFYHTLSLLLRQAATAPPSPPPPPPPHHRWVRGES